MWKSRVPALGVEDITILVIGTLQNEWELNRL
jgi:hypothetical protein